MIVGHGYKNTLSFAANAEAPLLLILDAIHPDRELEMNWRTSVTSFLMKTALTLTGFVFLSTVLAVQGCRWSKKHRSTKKRAPAEAYVKQYAK